MGRILVFLSVLSFCIENAQSTAAEKTSPNVTPGKEGEAEVVQWTRMGELGSLPKRFSNNLPLSDQSNQGKWIAYVPVTDEFEENALDRKKWIPGPRGWKGRQPSWFSPKNVGVQDGHLELTMKKEEPPEHLKKSGYHTYSSAIVYSNELVRYGYFEVRAKPMNSAGSSSFWFSNSEGPWRTEIDVFELGGKAKGFEHRYNMNLHVFHSPDSKEHWNTGGRWNAPWRFADDFHVYGLEWNDRELTYYVDGVPVRRVENTHWHQPLYMIFDSETMPNWLGLPEDEDLPSTYRIDYVRSWKSQVEKMAEKSSTTGAKVQ